MTPAQALVWAEAIRRRRALRLAEDMETSYIAAAAAQGGKQAFRALRATVKRLRREAGLAPAEDDLEEKLRRLGVTPRPARRKQ